MGEQGSELPPRDFGRRPPRNRSVSTAEVSSSRLAAMNRGLSPVSSRPRRTSVVHDLERREVGAAFDRAAVCLNPIGIPQPLAGSLELLGDPQMIELDRARDSLRDRVQCRRVAFGTHRPDEVFLDALAELMSFTCSPPQRPSRAPLSRAVDPRGVRHRNEPHPGLRDAQAPLAGTALSRAEKS